MSDTQSFYRAFEEKYRGSRELIKQRLQAYNPFILPLQGIYPQGSGIDLGCGRGEWLEVLREQGFDAHGVDLDDGMLAACLERQLPVKNQDAIAALAELADASQAIVSGFHIAEHMPFEVLQTLVREALRVLKPGGLLILETPNPENIMVGSSGFYLDPTHQRPLPPGLLRFVPEHQGFYRTKVVLLQEPKILVNSPHIRLYDVLSGVSPDYAIVAQKHAPAALLAPFASAFNRRYGLDIENLSGRFERNLQERLARLDRLEALTAHIEQRTAQAEQRAAEAHAALEGLLNSKSWKLTAPLRAAFTLVRDWRNRLRGQPAPVEAPIAEPTPTPAPAPVAVPTPACRLTRLHPHVLPVSPRLPEALLLPAPATDAPWVRLTGHVEGHYSLAIVNRGLAGALEQLTDGRLQFVPYHGQPYAEPPQLPPEQDAPLHAALRRQLPEHEADRAISLVHHYPFIHDPQPAALRAIVFFWEETSVPADTIAHLNSQFDLVLVASESVKRALLNSGCRPPVRVIPIGIDHLIGPHTAPLTTLSVREGQPLRFLHVSSAFERKGVDVLLAAYLDAFSADDAVELYIKTFPNPHNQIHAQLAALTAGRDMPARVIIDEAPLDDAGMLALYRSAHAMVLPTRGEGFNLPAAEALAMGLPVITTGHSAQADFCCHDTATLVNFRFAASRSHLRASDACWLEPDPVDLAAKLRQLRQRILDADPALTTQRQAGQQHVRDTYRWDNAAQALLASADWLGRQPAHSGPLRLALLSPWATRCGIAEYSQELLRAMAPPEVAVSIYCDERTDPAASAGAQVCWTLGMNDSVPLVLEQIGHGNAQVVLVQHQPSLFPLSDNCCAQLAQLHRQGRVVMLELHSTQPLLAECRVSAQGVAALAELDRIIVHKPEDLNHLLALGLSNNVMLLTLGVVQPLADPAEAATRAALGIPADALVLGCFGFALPHKGIDTLVDTVRPLEQASGRRVHLLGLNSVLDPRSEQMIEHCQEQAQALGVAGQVHWITDYRPITECQQLLGVADYVVFPYKYTRESASGAVTIGLSTLKPVLVSPLEIFSDLPDVTWRMDGHEADDIVQAVLTLSRQADVCTALVERQRQWLRARDWDTLSARLLTVMHSLRGERQLAHTIAPARQAWQADWAAAHGKQLLVDVSELYHRDARTGIQRVVRSVLNELFRAPPAGYAVCPVYASQGEPFRYTDKFAPHGAGPQDEQPIRVNAGDIFLGLDLAAHLFPEVESQLAAFRLAGAQVHYVVYDIIPLRYPHLTVAGISEAFAHWLSGLARHADGLMCISDAVAQDVRHWLLQQHPELPLPAIGHFHLGADLDQSSPSTGLPDNAASMLANLDAHTSFLMVGTIEPRKGHTLVLEAFEQLWAAGLDCRLVLVGKAGWNITELAERLRQHAEYGQRLLWLESTSDEYLEKIYRHTDCLIAASECEGFGLPLIEAAQHDLPILARDIAVFREVAGVHASYFSASQPDALAQAVRDWLDSYAIGSHPRSGAMPWLTWQASTQALLHAVLPPVRSTE